MNNNHTVITISDEDQPNQFENINMNLVRTLYDIFPDICPKFAKSQCKDPTRQLTKEVLIHRILMLNGNYPKRESSPPPEIDTEEQLRILMGMLPDADPDYLRRLCMRYEGRPDSLKLEISNAIEHNDYPKMEDYLRRQQISAQQRQYTVEFDVNNFLKLIPDPEKLFSDPTRNVALDPVSLQYATIVLRNIFVQIPATTIARCLIINKNNFFRTALQLYKNPPRKLLKKTRTQLPLPSPPENIPLLQEIAYFTHREAITAYLETVKETEQAEFQAAKSSGLLKTCECCFDDEILPRKAFTCQQGCLFCPTCINKSVEILYGEGKLDFPCLQNCPSYFSLSVLQKVLPPKLFSKIAQKKAVEDVKAAATEDFEICPFCDFVTIPFEASKIFTCLNPECMKESCRLCKKPSHIPLRCDEVEKDIEVEARVFIENKMTEALLKTCWQCGINFFKEEGCNLMTCKCGAKMCYICSKPVTDYKHFNGRGGDRFDLCPLFCDTNKLNKENVRQGAMRAKENINLKNLKVDPSKIKIEKEPTF